MIATNTSSITSLAILGIVVGLPSLALGATRLKFDAEARKRTTHWPAVDGIIVSSRLVENYRKGTWGKFSGVCPEIRYLYRVDGVEHEGTAVSLDGSWVGTRYRGLVSPLVRRYRPMKRVRVFVSPEDPDQAVLEPGDPVARAGGIGAIGAGVLFIAGGIAALVFTTI